jgi:hypothetical protein
MQTGEVDRVDALLRAAERALEPDRARTTLIADEDEARQLPPAGARTRSF